MPPPDNFPITPPETPPRTDQVPPEQELELTQRDNEPPPTTKTVPEHDQRAGQPTTQQSRVPSPSPPSPSSIHVLYLGTAGICEDGTEPCTAPQPPSHSTSNDISTTDSGFSKTLMALI